MADNVPGKFLRKSQNTQKKIEDLTNTINKVGQFVSVGAILANGDGLRGIRKNIGSLIDANLYDIKKELKAQAKSYAYQRVKEELPTEEEIIDKLLNPPCDILVMNTVKKTKEQFDIQLPKLENLLNASIEKIQKLIKKTDKSLNTLVNISAILISIQAVITALKILITAAKLSLLAFTGIFASGAAIERISSAIKKAEGLVFKYVEAVQTYVGYLLRVVDEIIQIFNLLPLILEIFSNLRDNVLIPLIKKISDYYERYIRRCLGDEGFDNDGNLSVENIDKFIDFNTSIIDKGSDTHVLGDYIHDDSLPEHRIYRPKIN